MLILVPGGSRRYLNPRAIRDALSCGWKLERNQALNFFIDIASGECLQGKVIEMVKIGY